MPTKISISSRGSTARPALRFSGVADDVATQLRDATLDVLWRQWAALGAGAAPRIRARAVIDPEAVVLASLAFVSEEPRLADLLHDWIARNADLLSVQRVKNLTRGYDEAVRITVEEGLRWLARIAVDDGKDMRWESLSKQRSTNDASASEWNVPTLRTNRKRATRARFTDATTLVLRLRLAFGVGVKADLVTGLLCSSEEWTTVHAISDMTGYTTAAVRRAAEDLAAARFIESRDGQPAGYRVAEENWRPLLDMDGELPPWRGWRNRFAFAADFLAWHRAATSALRTPYVIGVEGRELLDRHRAAFEHDRIAVWGPHTRIQDWTEFMVRSVSALARWMRENA
jgi:hypothetical protein